MVDKAALVEVMNEPYARYWAELGQFIHYFSDVERVTQGLLRAVAGVSDPMGAALFSGVKVDAATSLINRVCEATDRADLQARLKPIFDQLGVINGVRNNTVHWGAREDGGELVVSNLYFAATPDRIRKFPISATDLQLMIIDLIKISMHLSWEEMTVKGEIISPEMQELVFRKVLNAAWRYKPPQQSPPKNPRLPKLPKRSRPHEA
jgi:hypothetical protein